MSELDPIIHAPARLRILTTLDAVTERDDDEIAFLKLQRDLGLTPGNLTTHLGKLEQAGYIATEKTFEGKKPATYVRLTSAGRSAFRSYRTQLLNMIGGTP